MANHKCGCNRKQCTICCPAKSLRGPTGPMGSTGPTGSTGITGPTGPTAAGTPVTRCHNEVQAGQIITSNGVDFTNVICCTAVGSDLAPVQTDIWASLAAFLPAGRNEFRLALDGNLVAQSTTVVQAAAIGETQVNIVKTITVNPGSHQICLQWLGPAPGSQIIFDPDERASILLYQFVP